MTMPLMGATITKAYKELPPTGVTYVKGYHTGIDFTSPTKVIYAAVDGTIEQVSTDPDGWGKYIILRTKNGLYDLIHAHMSQWYVVRGQKVIAGDKLGLMGATGQVTGPHLHFEVRKAPWTNRNEVDPAAWLGIKNQRGAISMAEQSKPVTEDKDVYLSVRVRTSKADALVKQIIGMGYACKKMDLA